LHLEFLIKVFVNLDTNLEDTNGQLQLIQGTVRKVSFHIVKGLVA